MTTSYGENETDMSKALALYVFVSLFRFVFLK
jgi:hypothetical protein